MNNEENDADNGVVHLGGESKEEIEAEDKWHDEQKRLEEFGEYFKGNIDDKSYLHCNTIYVKNFLAESIQQAVAEERERMRGKIDGLKEVYMKKDDPEREGEEKDEVDSCCNETLNDLLSSLEDITTKE